MDVITTHINADFDSLASMLAAKKLYPRAVLVFPGSTEKNLRDFFLQSTFYVFQAERMKNVDLEAVKRLILVDTRQPGRIGKFGEVARRPGVELHIFDHHPPSREDLHGTVEHVREVGATVTILVRILREKEIPLTPEEATIMAVGLYEDTGSFSFSSTTPEDLQTAAFLLERGANLNIVSSLITRELTADQISLLNELVQSTTRHLVRGIEIVVARASADKYVGDFALLVHKLKDMENINVLFALARMEDRVYLVARSRIEEVNVGEIAAAFGGGGHATAAAATLRDMDLPEAEKRLLDYLGKQIQPLRLVRELMSFPVKTVQTQETIEHAGELLTRYNINVLPVMDDGRVAGLISRQVIEKAAFHGFKDSPVGDYMTSEFAVVTPRTPLTKVQDLVVGNNQRFLPVLDRGKLVGAITRTDLLRWLSARSNQAAPSLGETDFFAAEPRKRAILKIMEERLPPAVIQLLKNIGRKAAGMGLQAYAVGGFVRDLLLRKENFDIDVVVEGDGIRLARALAEEGKGELQVHRRFGTATLRMSEGFRLDLATARLEYYEHPGALPQVEHSSIKLDLYRRDFTVNALAIHLHPDHFGELIDFFGGQKDLKEKVIRVLHNLSFVEDPTRVFRALRFEQRIGFQIGRQTHMLMENAARLELFGRLSGKRLFRELVLCLSEEKPLPVLKRLRDYGLLAIFHPGLKIDRSLETRFQRLEEVIAWYRLLFTGEKFERWMVGFLGLTDGMTEKEMDALLGRFALAEKFRITFIQRRSRALQVAHRLSSAPPPARSDIFFLLDPLPADFLLYAMGRAEEEGVKKAISLYFTELKRARVSLTGKDLKRMGFIPGPIYTEILHALLRGRLERKITSRQEEVGFVLKKYDPKQQAGVHRKKPAPAGKKREGGQRAPRDNRTDPQRGTAAFKKNLSAHR